jgi:hypothetical protein
MSSEANPRQAATVKNVPTWASIEILFRPQEVAGSSVDEVQLGAGCALDNFILVVRDILVVVQPMLDIPACIRTFENERRHQRFIAARDRHLGYVNPICEVLTQRRARFSKNGYRFR